MTLNVNPSESPNEGRDSNEVSSSEVPVYQLMDGIDDSDDEIDDDTSDDSDSNNYELLAQDYNENNEQITYYQHNIVVNWIDADDYEANNETTRESNETIQTNVDVIQTNDSIHTTSCESSEASISQGNDLAERRLSLNDDQINEIKGLMSDFRLPSDNIPVWAQNIPEDQWKTLLLTKLEERKTNKELNK